MEAVKAGISRQEAHSRIRDLSMIATQNILNGGDNNLFELIKDDEVLSKVHFDVDPNKLTGIAEEQVRRMILVH